jgi:D-alanine--poly(phosphoribitol) ligase subunit 1
MGCYHYNLGSLFAERAGLAAEAPALRYPGGDISHARLLADAEGHAARLLRQGLGRGDVIAIAHNKAAPSYALMLGALRIGVPYVAIDTASPAARNAHILRISGARLLFVDEAEHLPAMQGLATEVGIPALLLDGATPPLTEADRLAQQDAMAAVDGACIAYIMFTSGSTGMPKGVAVTHQNVLHFIEWGRQRFGIGPGDNFANLSPMYFDNSVFDFYVGLFNGAALTPVHRRLLTAPAALVAHVAGMGCTIWFSVPSLLIYLATMKALTAAALPALRRIIFGGEGYPKTELVKLHRMFGRQAQLVNVYGPTECTCICSAHDITDADFEDMAGLPTLGRLNPNFDHLVLDEDGAPAEQGELCLIGPNVAAGYFNDPDRSAAAFVTLTDPARFMKRMYRTGDLVRRDAGLLHFVGRKDNQVKHMGYRIELEEVEHGLARLPGVFQAAVIYQRTNAAYGKLIGFVATSGAAEEAALRQQLSQHLPDYMIPSRIILTDHLPKSPNGKVDRQRLAALLPEHAG